MTVEDGEGTLAWRREDESAPRDVSPAAAKTDCEVHTGAVGHFSCRKTTKERNPKLCPNL